MPYNNKSGPAGPAFVSRLISALRMLFCIAAVAVVAGCAPTRGGPIPYSVQNFNAPDATPVATLDEDYKIAPLDTLHVSVFQVADLTGDYEVDLTGTISLPLIGNVKAVDLTTHQLDDKITQLLGG